MSAGEQEVRFLGDLQRLQRRPDDLFVLSVDHPVSREEAERIRAEWKAIVGNERLVIVTRGYRLGLIGSDVDDQPAASNAVKDVLAERQRQISVEGWIPEHDDQHEDGQMARAAACYAMQGDSSIKTPLPFWPWSAQWWKPKNHRRNLVRAAALLLAEIERVDRKEGRTHA